MKNFTPPTHPPGPPAHEETDTRALILRAALETLAERQSSATRLRQIAEKAGLHYGNLHYYFRSKNDLYLALLDSMLAPIVEERKAMMANPNIPPADKLDTLLNRNRELIERGSELRVILDFLVQSAGNPAVRSKLQTMYRDWRADVAAILAQGIERGDFHPAQPELLPTLIVSLIEGFTNQYLLDPSVGDPAEFFDEVRTFLYCILK